MNPRLLELREERGRLRARSEMLRQNIVMQSHALTGVCGTADRVRHGFCWVKRHPYCVGLCVAFLVLVKPRRLWPVVRWGGRLFVLRQGWQRALGFFVFAHQKVKPYFLPG
jgi:hypothetical protein